MAVLGYLALTYVIDPQIIKKEELMLQKSQTAMQIQMIESSIQDEAMLDETIEDEYRQIKELAKQFYNTTPQEELILLFNDLLYMSEIQSNMITFPAPSLTTIENIEFLETTINIDFRGEYQSLMNLFDTVWKFPKRIKVDRLNLNVGENGLQGSVSFELIHLLVDAGVVDNLYAWYIDELFMKENPFSPLEKDNTTVRYLYTGEDENLFNASRFKEFTDITGHWVENEINSYLKEGYIYMNPYNTFGPDSPITRGEFVVLLDNVYKWTNEDDEIIDLTKFTDYELLGDMASAYARAIQKGFISGFLEGYDDNTLRPNNPITYSEIELIMNRIKQSDSFTWSIVAADITAQKGISSAAWSDLSQNMTRAEAIYLLTYFK